MQLFKEQSNFDFVGKRKIAAILSVILIAVSIFSIVTRGLNFGIDFTGGTMVEVGYQENVELQPIRDTLDTAGFDGAIVQHFGSTQEVLIRLPVDESKDMATLSNQVLDVLDVSEEQIRRVEFVGPQVGEELTNDGGLAMLYALIGILIYVSLRFEYRFAIGSVTALVHDVILVIGFFSITRIEFDLTVLAAILAVIGYSLNDTIVVFDRVRETFLKMRKGNSEEIVNRALNDTLSRTVITSLTTLLVVLSLFLFGGEVIHSFSIALLLGIIVGTYSSIYIASSAVLAMGVSKSDLLPPVRGEDEPEIGEDGAQV